MEVRCLVVEKSGKSPSGSVVRGQVLEVDKDDLLHILHINPFPSQAFCRPASTSILISPYHTENMSHIFFGYLGNERMGFEYVDLAPNPSSTILENMEKLWTHILPASAPRSLK